MARNDARLHGGYAPRIGEDALVGGVRGAETIAQCCGWFVGSDGAEAFHARPEGGEIGGDVACAAEALALLDEIDYGDSRFGRKARGGAPEIAVEHEVAENADALTAQAGDQALQPLGVTLDLIGHKGRDCGGFNCAILRPRWPLRAASREYRREWDRRAGRSGTSGRCHPASTSRESCTPDRQECRAALARWPRTFSSIEHQL